MPHAPRCGKPTGSAIFAGCSRSSAPRSDRRARMPLPKALTVRKSFHFKVCIQPVPRLFERRSIGFLLCCAARTLNSLELEVWLVETGGEHAMVAASALKVVVVDDEEVMRTLMQRTLERMGISQIYAAEDGSEGLDLARSQSPDVIIADYAMPNMDGIELLKAVRELPAYAKTAFIMLTGSANNVVRQRAWELGANSVIMKPVFPADLRDKLEALVHELTGARIEWKSSKGL